MSGKMTSNEHPILNDTTSNENLVFEQTASDYQESARAVSIAPRGLASALGSSFDPMAAVGGVRGLIETGLPGLVFLIVYVASHNLAVSVTAPIIVLLVLIVARLVQRQDLAPAIGGMFGLAVSAFVAWHSGQAEDYFVIGLVTNALYGAALVISLLVRWPLMGLLIGVLRGDATSWRKDPAKRALRRRYTGVTWLWAVLFIVRFVAQLPLYLAGNTEALAVVKLAMGPGLFALVAWLTWLLVRGNARPDLTE